MKPLVIALIALAMLGWEKWQKFRGVIPTGDSRAVPTETGGGAKGGERNQPSARPSSNGAVAKQGNYEVYQGCRLLPQKNNDGDSFLVQLPGGREEVFRLYFVDTPESAFKTYPGGSNNYQRIDDQAAYFGGITPEQAVEIGKKGKEYTLDLLGRKPFTLYTHWDEPFGDRRYHAFIQVDDSGKSRWLDELLVQRGLCRIYTKGAEMPDGTPTNRRKDQLFAMEREAKGRRVGGWGLR